MDLVERLGWMLFGGVIGLFAGYLLRYLQEMKEELDEVDGIVKRKLSDRNDDGFMGNRLIADVMMVVVLIIVVLAALLSQHSSNTVKETQQEQVKTNACTKEYLTKTVRALNERTEFTIAQAQSNVALQKAQADFFSLLLRRPPETVNVREKAAQDYLETLQGFVSISEKTRLKAEQFPYPTDHELKICYTQANN